MSEAEYETGSVNIPAGGMLLLYTDGLTDSIAGNDPEKRLSAALIGDLTRAIERLKSLVNPRFNQDDVTILLVRRSGEPV
jgi:serine phosphatase RsbU (regulator of sigma subunit)